MSAIGIIGTGSYVPAKVMNNHELSKMLNTSDDWIFEKVGIKSRRIADPHEATSDLGIYASLEALRNASVHSDEIDLIVLATSTPDMIQPATAAIIQGKLGALNSAAFDVSAVCAGFIFAISVAHSMMTANPAYRKALVIGAETYSRILDWTDRSTCVYFGDGAGAVVLGEVEEGFGIKSTFLHTDGRGANVIKFLGGGSRYPSSSETLAKNMHRFEMQGRQVWDFAIRVFPESVKRVARDAGCDVRELNYVISHQANINIIRRSLETLGLGMANTYTTIERYGNTSGASVPLTLAEADREGVFKRGDKIVLVGFGGGLSYGAVYLTWSKGTGK